MKHKYRGWTISLFNPMISYDSFFMPENYRQLKEESDLQWTKVILKGY